MRRSKLLVIALAVVAPLAAVGYLVWVFFETTAEIDRQSLSPTDGWIEWDPVDPADLHGIWASRAEGRECRLDFRPDGKLIWTTRTTVERVRTIELVVCYDYRFELGRFLVTMRTEQSHEGKVVALGDAERSRTAWKLDWKADDKSTFQLRTDRQDIGRPHLLFRKVPPEEKK
jgi:hypothetical protein